MVLGILGIEAEILGQIIRCFYSGEILLSLKNLKERKFADHFGIDFLMLKCIELYANGLEMDCDLAIEIRNVCRRSGCNSTLKMELKNANNAQKRNASI